MRVEASAGVALLPFAPLLQSGDQGHQRIGDFVAHGAGQECHRPRYELRGFPQVVSVVRDHLADHRAEVFRLERFPDEGVGVDRSGRGAVVCTEYDDGYVAESGVVLLVHSERPAVHRRHP